jgi:hypothetical protein
MRALNVWFDGLTFLLAVFMAACSARTIIDFARGKGGGLAGSALAAGVFLLMAISFFLLSLRVGNAQRRARETERGKGDSHQRGKGDSHQI